MTGEHKHRILILYAGYGDGHYQAAKALKETFSEHGVRDVVMADLFRQANRAVYAISKYAYIKSYRVLPSVYGWLYNGTKHLRWHKFPARRIQSYGLQTLHKMIRAEQPDFVIYTFPMSAVQEIGKRLGIHIPSAAVVTDFDFHRRWLHPGIDRYYVATADLKAKFVKAGIPEQRVVVSGIPVKPLFERTPPGELRDEDGNIPDRANHTILVMAGAYGVLHGIADLCDRLSRSEELRIVLVCGRNRPLQEEMEKRFRERRNVRIFGYVEQIHELMRISTCVVTKPGGVTLAEAIMMRLPILIYRPVPGQERNNARYLLHRGAALISHDAAQLETQIMRLVRDRDYLDRMRQSISRLQTPRAADLIVREILRYLQRNGKK